MARLVCGEYSVDVTPEKDWSEGLPYDPVTLPALIKSTRIMMIDHPDIHPNQMEFQFSQDEADLIASSQEIKNYLEFIDDYNRKYPETFSVAGGLPTMIYGHPVKIV